MSAWWQIRRRTSDLGGKEGATSADLQRGLASFLPQIPLSRSLPESLIQLDLGSILFPDGGVVADPAKDIDVVVDPAKDVDVVVDPAKDVGMVVDPASDLGGEGAGGPILLLLCAILDVDTNDHIVNKLDEPFLLTWKGIKQRKNYGKTVCWAPTSPSLQAKTTHTGCKPRTRSAPSPTSLPPPSNMPAAASGASTSLMVPSSSGASTSSLGASMSSSEALPIPDGLFINGVQKSSYFIGAKGRCTIFVYLMSHRLPVLLKCRNM